MMARTSWMVAALCVGLTCLLSPAPAAGQASAPSAGDKAAAQVLFDEARELLDAEEYDQACPKFAESMRLDPALGTQLNLARCYQLQGKTASAWINFKEAATKARRAGESRREQIARKFADELEPKLSRMTIEVPHRVEGMEVRRGAALVREAQWGSSVPVDPGSHEVVVTAPGYFRWTESVEVGEEADEVTVTVGELEPAPEDVDTTGGGPVAPLPPDGDDGTAHKALGIVAGVLGVGGITLGAIFGAMAMSDNDESIESHCLPEDPNRCDAAGVELREDATTEGNVSTVGFVAGGALLVTGVVLLATAPWGDEPAEAPAEPVDEDALLTDLQVLPLVGFEPQAPAGRPSSGSTAGVLIQGRW